MTRRSLSCCALLALTLACGDKKESTKVDKSPLNEDELCALYGTSSNNPMTECVAVPDPSFEVTVNATTDCEPNSIGRQWAQALLDSVNSGRVTIDWAKARACTKEARAQIAKATSPIGLVTSSDWQALVAGDCGTFYTANVDTDGACVYQWDCKNVSDLCSSPPPYTSATFTCIAPGKAGDACDGLSGICAAGLYCNGAPGICTATPTPCTSDAQCGDNETGLCQEGACLPNGSVGLGGACSNDRSCKDACAHCQIPTGLTTGSCALRGATGAACAARTDCADDLGCNADSTCGVVTAGAACAFDGGGTSQTVCASGLTCLGDTTCDGADQATCTAKVPACRYTNGNCAPDVGTCTTLPTSGACLTSAGDEKCARHYTCTGDNQCHANLTSGATCDQGGVTTARCDDGFVCTDAGLCATACSDDAPCADGQYCTEESFCAAIVTGACNATGEADQCGPTFFCAAPAAECATFTTQASCTPNADCSWNGSTCVAAASAAAHCTSRRHPGDRAVGGCQVSGGDIGENNSCDSGFCLSDGVNPPTCVVAPRGCLNYGFASQLPMIFALGMVVAWRKRKRAS